MLRGAGCLLITMIFLQTAINAAAKIPIERAGKCTIDIRPNLSPEEFLNTYYLKQPVIVPIKAKLKTNKHWSINQLKRKFGRINVKVGSSSHITKNRGTSTRQQKLSSFVQDLNEANKANKANMGNIGYTHREVFAFERNPDLFKNAKQLIRLANEIPFNYLHAINRTLLNQTDWYLSVGNLHSGVHAHHHSDGWSYLFRGRKRWFFWQSWSSLPPFTHVARFPIRDWYFHHVYPQLRPEEMPEECEAVKGDFIYIPEGWWHATLSMSDVSVAVASQMKSPVSELGQRWSSIVDHFGHKNVTELNATLQQLEIMHEKHSMFGEAWHYGGTVMGKLSALHNQKNHIDLTKEDQWNLVKKELAMKKTAVEISPTNCPTLHNFGLALVKSRQFDKAIEMLEKAVMLCHWDKQLERSLEFVRDLIAKQQGYRRQRRRQEATPKKTDL